MKLLIANWKMNPETLDQAVALAKATDFEGVVLCPPSLFLSDVKHLVTKALVGAQDLFWEKHGAFTGAISAPELTSLGVRYVILGHSDMRKNFGETNARVGKKVGAAVRAGLSPIVCIGETLSERENGRTEDVLRTQLGSALAEIFDAPEQEICIAYEPVWAISTNRTEASPEITPEDIKKALLVIKEFIDNQVPHIASRVLYLYGGSIDSRNIKAIFSLYEVQGGLVGGASLKPAEFTKMLSIRGSIDN